MIMSVIVWIGMGILTALGLWCALGIVCFMADLIHLVWLRKEVDKAFPPGSQLREQYTMLGRRFNAGLIIEAEYLAGVKDLQVKAGYRAANNCTKSTNILPIY